MAIAIPLKDQLDGPRLTHTQHGIQLNIRIWPLSNSISKVIA